MVGLGSLTEAWVTPCGIIADATNPLFTPPDVAVMPE